MTLVASHPEALDSASLTMDPAPPRRRWSLPRRPQGGLGLLFWLVVMAILVLPIALFLIAAVSPRLLGQGPAWLTLQGFRQAFTSTFLVSIVNSLEISVAAGVLATVTGGMVAWLVLRTSVIARALWSGSMFALLLAPSYLVAMGWQRLFDPGGVLQVLGLPVAAVHGLLYGPLGVIMVLAFKGVPFAYLAITGALRGLGEEFESAARVHGGGRISMIRMLTALIAPAIWSSFAIVFAESISDFGVAATLANAANYPVATYTLYMAIDNYPPNFAAAAAVGWVLVALVALALVAQSRALRGRSYRVIGGRTRPARRQSLSLSGQVGAVAFLSGVVVIGLGVPAIGAVMASMLKGLGGLAVNHQLTLSNYGRALHSPDLVGPLKFSTELATVAATVTVVLALIAAQMMSNQKSKLTGRMLDMLLVASVALPGIVFAAGYIFTYNLPLVTKLLGVDLYGTTTLLLLAYIANALPSTSRVLLGSVSQVQATLHQAGRVHGRGAVASWRGTVLPVLARPLVAAWVLTFAATLLELPVSELLYPPGKPPISVGITAALSKFDYGGGTAMEVLAVLLALVVVGIAWGLFALFAPRGWLKIGASRAK